MYEGRSKKYVGVYKYGDWWRPYIKLSYGIKWLGLFSDEISAAKVRDCALRSWKRSESLYQFKDEELSRADWSRFRFEITQSADGTRGPDRKKRKQRSKQL